MAAHVAEADVLSSPLTQATGGQVYNLPMGFLESGFSTTLPSCVQGSWGGVVNNCSGAGATVDLGMSITVGNSGTETLGVSEWVDADGDSPVSCIAYSFATGVAVGGSFWYSPWKTSGTGNGNAGQLQSMSITESVTLPVQPNGGVLVSCQMAQGTTWQSTQWQY